jgi:hypothetical protein
MNLLVLFVIAAHFVLTQELQQKQGLAVDGEKNLAEKIQKMKEEMYSVLYECKEKNMFHGSLARDNGRLLEDLSVQVEPRTNDFRWYSLKHLHIMSSIFIHLCQIMVLILYCLTCRRSHRRGKMVSDSAMLAGVFSVTYVVFDKLTGHPKGRHKIEPAL